jgi:methionyl-tRNA formyltransferase
MNLVFCGTPKFAVPTLRKLVDCGYNVTLVVTQPDRPSGRGLELAASPVKQFALEHKLAIVQPEKIKNNTEFKSLLQAHQPQAIIVVGYGRIIPHWMIDLPPWGNLNVHASLLPKYRGAAPIQWAIASGETVTGVTTMRIDAGLDTGDMLLQREMTIEPDDTSLTIAPPLAELGADLLIETLHGLEGGTIKAKPQDHSRHTLAPILKKEDGRVDFSRSAQHIYDRFRGFQPWPGAYTYFRGKQVALHAIQPVGGHGTPGEIHVAGESLIASCANGSAIRIDALQPEGKRRMSARDFINGHRPQPGERFQSPASPGQA